MTEARRVGIVGGGISGLFLLHLLRERGISAVLFEASSIPGGVMRSDRIEGPSGSLAADLGPQRMRLTRGLAGILEAAGLTDSILLARTGIPFTIHRDGRLIPAPTSFREAFHTPLISWRGKIRALGDLITPGPSPDESVAQALTRKLGPEIHARIAGPLLGGLYASNPDRMEARHTLLPAMGRTGHRRSLLLALARAAKWDRVPVISLSEGMGMLPRALAALHADHVRLDTPVRGVAPARGGTKFEIHTDGDRVPVDRVALTLPAPQAAQVLGSLAPALAARLGGLNYNPLAVVPLVVPAGVRPPDVGSGFKMTLEDSLHTRGVTAHDALFGREGLFTAFLGGMGDEAFVERPDDEILQVAAAEFRTVTGASAVPRLVHRTWMPAWDRSWRALDDLELPAGIHLCAAFSDRPGIAGRLEDARRTAERLVQGA